MNKLRKTIGFLLIVVSLCAMYGWEKWGRNMYLYKEMAVLNLDAEKNTKITKEMIGSIKVNFIPSGALSTSEAVKIIGLSAKQLIHKNTPVFQDIFEEEELILNEKKGQFIMSIPNQWLKSYPQTLRRGDTAYFYVDGEFITSAVVAYSKDGSNQEVVSEDKDRLSASSTVSLVEVVVTKEQAQLLSRVADNGKQLVILYN